MKLINADTVVTANLYDDEYEEFCHREMTVKEYLDLYADEGCPEAVEAIPVAWIEEHIKWLKSLENAFSNMTAMNIEVMLKKWREEQK